MFPDKKEYKEAAHIADELFSDQSYELERQCMSVQRGVERNLFTLSAALNAYNVKLEEYEDFLAKAFDQQLKTSLSTDTDSNGYSKHYLQVITRMVHFFAGEHNPNFNPVIKELNKLSEQV